MTPTPSFAERAVEQYKDISHFRGENDIRGSCGSPCHQCEKDKIYISFLLAKLAEAEQRTATAFGGCKFCYGKGYGTATEYREGSDDFGGEAFREKLPSVIPCPKCERGEQLDKFFKEEEQRGYDRGRSYFQETALEVAKEANYEQALVVAEQRGRDSAVDDIRKNMLWSRNDREEKMVYERELEIVLQAARHLTTPS